jgi:hypothetical protein
VYFNCCQQIIDQNLNIMAEIHVQAKKHNSSPAWIWIVAVVLIAAAVIYFLMNRNNNNQVDKPNQTNTTSSVELTQQVAGYDYVLTAA